VRPAGYFGRGATGILARIEGDEGRIVNLNRDALGHCELRGKGLKRHEAMSQGTFALVGRTQEFLQEWAEVFAAVAFVVLESPRTGHRGAARCERRADHDRSPVRGDTWYREQIQPFVRSG